MSCPAGRLILGVGAGWLREEFEALDSPAFNVRGAVTDEWITIFKQLWSQSPASFNGRFYRYTDIRCEPFPVQKGGPPIILGAHGPKALERVARSYDGWMPLVPGPAELKREVTTLRKLLKERGRAENSVQISPLVDPLENGPSSDELKAYRDAGADRLVMLSQQTVAATADGGALDLIKRFTRVVERNRAI